MPVTGIDYNVCSDCETCLSTCPTFFWRDKEKNRIVFRDPRKRCILCGQCIATCPENAIEQKDMGESCSFEGIDKPETIISYDAMYNFLRAHRSVRHYKKEKVPGTILHKVFNAMQYAPTSANMRAENFSIISDDQRIKTLSDAVEKALLTNPGYKDMYAEAFAINDKRFRSPVYHDAPHVIFVFSGLNMEMETANIANMVTYGRLAAQALGLGTCWNGWTQIAMDLDQKIKELAGVRGSKVGVFTLGYPDVTFYRTPPRKFKLVNGLD